MITKKGYSKDQTLMPDGIALTLPVAFFQDRNMTIDQFKKYFERLMANEDVTWNFKLSNLPKQDILYVYFIFGGFIQYRLIFVQYERNQTKQFKDSTDKKVRTFTSCNWVICCGPAIKPIEEWPQKGFQGFRYTTHLF